MAGQPLLTGINHVVFHTNDMDKTTAFYAGLLGLKVKVTYAPPAGVAPELKRLYFFELPNGDNITFEEITAPIDVEAPFIAEFHWSHAGGPARAERPRVFNHLCFNIGSEDELRALRARLEVAGHRCSEVSDTPAAPFVRSFFLYDPNWIPIEVAVFYDPASVGKAADWWSDPQPVPSLASAMRAGEGA